jgi:trehalose/maltose hydrolase-like predicted phosphorylase
MLYGFLGFEPTAEGCRIAPQLPSTWPELTVMAIRIHDSQIDVTARRDGSVRLRRRVAGTNPLAIEAGGAAATLPPETGAEVTLPAD